MSHLRIGGLRLRRTVSREQASRSRRSRKTPRTGFWDKMAPLYRMRAGVALI